MSCNLEPCALNGARSVGATGDVIAEPVPSALGPLTTLVDEFEIDAVGNATVGATSGAITGASLRDGTIVRTWAGAGFAGITTCGDVALPTVEGEPITGFGCIEWLGETLIEPATGFGPGEGMDAVLSHAALESDLSAPKLPRPAAGP